MVLKTNVGPIVGCAQELCRRLGCSQDHSRSDTHRPSKAPPRKFRPIMSFLFGPSLAARSPQCTPVATILSGSPRSPRSLHSSHRNSMRFAREPRHFSRLPWSMQQKRLSRSQPNPRWPFRAMFLVTNSRCPSLTSRFSRKMQRSRS
jgi:hypothetical protein